MVREGSAALVVSGPRDSHDAVLDALLLIAPTVAHVGPGEEARLVKICHNLLLAVITQGLSEVTTLAEKAELSDQLEEQREDAAAELAAAEEAARIEQRKAVKAAVVEARKDERRKAAPKLLVGAI